MIKTPHSYNPRPPFLSTDESAETKARELFNKALGLMNAGKFKEAIPLYKEILAMLQFDPVSWNNLGVAYWHLLEWKEANKCFKNVLAIDPTDRKASKNLRILKEEWDAFKKEKSKMLPAASAEKEKQTDSKPAEPQLSETPTYSIPVKFLSPEYQNVQKTFQSLAAIKDVILQIEYANLNIQREFDELLCLTAIKDVDRHWYQVETVKRVLKYFHGRVLLCDEVGLGKTIEAGMLMKEYILRGMAKNILILTPAPLVSQWQEEMRQKFGIDFITSDDPLFHADSDAFWKKKFIIASIHTAKGSKNFPRVTGRFYDLVIVDEAHHLKNRKTLAWNLVNEIKKRFVFLLTATPVQNNLIELYNLITLLKPGQFKTEKIFKQEFLQRGNLTATVNREKLKTMLRDVIIRNTRSAIDLKLPKRFASTIRIKPTETEQAIYNGITGLVREISASASAPLAQLLLREAGSSPFALKNTLAGLSCANSPAVASIIKLIDNAGEISKGKALLEILQKNPGEKKIIFTQYLKSMDYVTSLLAQHGIPFVTFRGDMSAIEKDESIRSFKDNIPVLVSAESGGEGRNLQFCNTLINFDLPWNPMKIEQRIGRIHRIGQTRDVFIFNLSVHNTIEDHIITIMDTKINMFEMVIGEIEPILGYLGEDKEFEDIIMDIWLKSGSEEESRKGFEKLGQKLVDAKNDYLRSKQLDKNLFEEDYEV